MGKRASGRPRMPRRNRGALSLLAVLLFASGALRMGGGAGEAIAKELSAIGAAPQPAALAGCEPQPDLEIVLQSLSEREHRVERRETALEERLAALKAAEEEIQLNIAALTAAEDELAATMALAQEAAEGDLTRLTAIYENMKPKEAAALFETMDPGFAAGFLGRMRPAAAAAVMAGLSPESSYSISVMLAGRNADVPTE